MSEPAPRYAAEVRDAIVAAYYQRVTALADAARSRAQSAYATASAFAGSFLAGGLLLARERVGPAVTVLGLAATACWALAAALYVHAVAAPVSRPPTSQPDADAFVGAVLEQVSSERSAVDRRQRRANLVAVAAILLSLVTVAVRLAPASWGRDRGEVVLSDEGVRAVQALCPGTGRTVAGEVDLAGPSGEYVTVRPDACQGRRVELRIPRDQVHAVSVARP
ncbi:MAG TPA: hypothetical protein VKG45_07000 [Actinomycetes bacterium]|nr:hypothetical protein [Actinomycetes bacterium]